HPSSTPNGATPSRRSSPRRIVIQCSGSRHASNEPLSDAELVALGVPHDGEVVALIFIGPNVDGTECNETPHFDVDGALRLRLGGSRSQTDVAVDAVLDDLRFRDPMDQQRWP